MPDRPCPVSWLSESVAAFARFSPCCVLVDGFVSLVCCVPLRLCRLLPQALPGELVGPGERGWEPRGRGLRVLWQVKPWPGGRGPCSPAVRSEDGTGRGRGGAWCRWKMLFCQEKGVSRVAVQRNFPGQWRAAGCLWAISGLQASLVSYRHRKSGRCQYPGFWLLSTNWKIWERWCGSLISRRLSFPICKTDPASPAADLRNLIPLCFLPSFCVSSLTRVFLCTCAVTGIVLGTGDTAGTRQAKAPVLVGLALRCREIETEIAK